MHGVVKATPAEHKAYCTLGDRGIYGHDNELTVRAEQGVTGGMQEVTGLAPGIVNFSPMLSPSLAPEQSPFSPWNWPGKDMVPYCSQTSQSAQPTGCNISLFDMTASAKGGGKNRIGPLHPLGRVGWPFWPIIHKKTLISANMFAILNILYAGIWQTCELLAACLNLNWHVKPFLIRLPSHKSYRITCAPRLHGTWWDF